MLLDNGAQVNAVETWGGTTALMWAVSERHLDTASCSSRTARMSTRVPISFPRPTAAALKARRRYRPRPIRPSEELAGGWLTPLMFAAREGDLEIARSLVAAERTSTSIAGDGKDALGLAIFNGQYDCASFLIDNKSNVNHADAQRFTPLFWAVDRRNMELGANGFPWTVTTDPLPLIKKLLDAGANPNAIVNNTPRARNRDAFAANRLRDRADRAAFAGDSKSASFCCLTAPIRMPSPATGNPCWKRPPDSRSSPAIRRAVRMPKRVELVQAAGGTRRRREWADAYGITPLMAAANLGDTKLVQYLVDRAPTSAPTIWAKG